MSAPRASGPPPLDTRVDRRSFLSRMAGLSAAGAGTLVVPFRAGADEVERVAPNGYRTLPPDAGGGGLRARSSLIRFPRLSLNRVESLIQQVTEPAELTLAEAAALIHSGRLSSTELVESCLDRIRRLDPVLQAFNTVLDREALAEARVADDQARGGPLQGIPLAVKDNFYTAGVRTTANSLIFEDFVPSWDATVVARLKAAGAIVLGKTQMGPLATTRATTPSGDPTTANAWAPFDPEVEPGGSSSGSATAVAGRLATSSTGTQTGGSITSPSNAQGLTGIKPTMGRVSLHGVIPLTYTRDHAGPIARDALDAAIVLQAMAGPDRLDPRTLGLPPVPDYVLAAEPLFSKGSPRLRWPTTIGVIPGYTVADREQEEGEWEPPAGRRRPEETPEERERRLVRRRARAAAEVTARSAMLETFGRLGARVVEVPLPDEWEPLTSRSFNNARLVERGEAFLEHLQRDVRLFGVSLSPWINGLLLSGDEYLRAQRARVMLLRRVLDDVFSRCDVVVQTTPIPFDMMGLPLIAFPIGMESGPGTKRPVGAMLGGAPFGEERLLSVVAAFQAATDWHKRRPADPDPGGSGRSLIPADLAPRRIDALDVMELTQ